MSSNVEGIEKILKERGRRYGSFVEHASITQDIKKAMKGDTGHAVVYGSKWDSLADNKKEALEMIAHKIGRILTGDSDYKDSWVDIEGYAHLVSVTLRD